MCCMYAGVASMGAHVYVFAYVLKHIKAGFFFAQNPAQMRNFFEFAQIFLAVCAELHKEKMEKMRKNDRFFKIV